MSVESLVSDVNFLKENGRYEGALSLVLAAIDASSVKMFPKGEMSIKNPRDVMRPGERFKLCFGYGVRRILSGYEPESIDEWRSKFYINYKGKEVILEDILYSDYRCALIHEGELPDHVGFVDISSTGYHCDYIDVNGFKFSIQNETLILDYKCLDFFVEVVNSLPVNGGQELEKLSGIPSLKVIDGLDLKEIYAEFYKKYSLSGARVDFLLDLLTSEGANFMVLNSLDSESIKLRFKSGIDSGAIPQHAITALRATPSYDNEFVRLRLISDEGMLHDDCVEAIRELALKFEWK
ncbi:hypothetical protein JEQ05_12575 [Serratia liquefaciens]|uniref:hypothetical protein n=1 Tax=Serratia liquefaciens TaxID=614 RepID=UPI0018E4B84B|nr:hypothetical protein [Serratia liquefaciens]MBI6162462.1 hypothetical protein [Serratia liquefaciens]